MMATSQTDIDNALAILQSNKGNWAMLNVEQRIRLIDEIIENMRTVAALWVAAELKARDLDPKSETASEAWTGMSFIFRLLHTLRKSLYEIFKHGRPLIPGPVRTREDGQVIVPVVPRTIGDRLLNNRFAYQGITAEVRMEPGVTAEEVTSAQAHEYHDDTYTGNVTLILGAGNQGFLVVGEVLHHLFVKLRAVILKMNSVNEYLGPLIEKTFRALVEQGFFKVVYGDVAEGNYLTNHPAVEEIHMTGSHKTYEAIVFGSGEEGTKRKSERKPLITKRFTAELGSVNPIIVVPGQWSKEEINHQAGTLVGTLTHNAGFNCNTTRVIVTYAGWPQRGELIDAIRNILARVPNRQAYYPNAQANYSEFLAAHPEAEQFGKTGTDTLPWMFIPSIDPTNRDDFCFKKEPFGGIFGETSIKAESIPEYIERAVDFLNETLWGTLTSTIIVHPDSLTDYSVAVEQAISNLKYGTVGINVWGAVSYTLGVTTWGAFPGHNMYDIQSGIGVVGNMLMLDRPQKTVIRGPFKQIVQPFALVNNFNNFSQRLSDYEAKPSPWKLVSLIREGIRVNQHAIQ